MYVAIVPSVSAIRTVSILSMAPLSMLTRDGGRWTKPPSSRLPIKPYFQAVVRSDGGPTFPGRAVAGLSGAAVRARALDATRRLVALREAGGWSFSVLAMGGVTDADSFAALFDAGADAVQSASGAFADPFLARDCIAALGDTLPRSVPR